MTEPLTPDEWVDALVMVTTALANRSGGIVLADRMDATVRAAWANLEAEERFGRESEDRLHRMAVAYENAVKERDEAAEICRDEHITTEQWDELHGEALEQRATIATLNAEVARLRDLLDSVNNQCARTPTCIAYAVAAPGEREEEQE